MNDNPPYGPKPSDVNARHFRMFEEAQIDNAFEASNLRQLERLCITALNDPFLPVLFRAKYEVYISLCPGRDPDHHLTNAEQMFERVQKKIDEGEESDFAIGMLAALKGSRDVIRANMVKVDLKTGEVVGEVTGEVFAGEVVADKVVAGKGDARDVEGAGVVKVQTSAVHEKERD